ncbi:MAG TPA: hypothetical protein VGW34_03735 [Allosphingosinicella sp.]|nr:hypothetical protein [Allosphingosinicella sp.]
MRPLLDLKLRLRAHPWVFKTVYKRKERAHWKARVVRPGDDAVIEGYPRSANTFASYAFLESQGDSIRFGNHFHTPAQFELARRYRIPAMLVLRNPVDAALSMMIFDGAMDATEALLRYIAFHRPLLAITDSFVVAPFEEVTSDFGRSIDRLNDRFGSGFNRFDHSPEMQQRVFDRIAANRRARIERDPKKHTANPLKTTTPTPEKLERQRQLAAAFEDSSLEPLKVEARRQYERLMATL